MQYTLQDPKETGCSFSRCWLLTRLARLIRAFYTSTLHTNRIAPITPNESFSTPFAKRVMMTSFRFWYLASWTVKPNLGGVRFEPTKTYAVYQVAFLGYLCRSDASPVITRRAPLTLHRLATWPHTLTSIKWPLAFWTQWLPDPMPLVGKTCLTYFLLAPDWTPSPFSKTALT